MAVWPRRAARAPAGLAFLTWAAERGLVPWDVPPLGCELPAGAHGRREPVGAFRGVLADSDAAFVVRQLLVAAPGGGRTWWTSAMTDPGGHVVCTTEPLTEPGEFEALLDVLEAEVLATAPRSARRARVSLVA